MIPRQAASKEEAEFVDDLGSDTSSVSIWAIIISFATTVFMMSTLGFVWSMINNL